MTILENDYESILNHRVDPQIMILNLIHDLTAWSISIVKYYFQLFEAFQTYHIID